MSLELAHSKWHQAAQNKVNEMETAYDFEISETRKSRRDAKLGGTALVLSGAANLIDTAVDYMPKQWEPYVRIVSAVSAAVAISGLVGLKYHTDRAASKARIALAYAIPNEIALPLWTHPYVLDNRELFERNQIEASSPQ